MLIISVAYFHFKGKPAKVALLTTCVGETLNPVEVPRFPSSLLFKWKLRRFNRFNLHSKDDDENERECVCQMDLKFRFHYFEERKSTHHCSHAITGLVQFFFLSLTRL
jgi:hypothetical protein